MGMENDVLLSYLEDNGRFADLFNCFYFQGEPVVKARELKEASEVYASPRKGRGNSGRQRIRDIKRRLESGGLLKILAVEAQSEISYCMPWRIMDYDCREYGQQISRIQRRNREAEAALQLQRQSREGNPVPQVSPEESAFEPEPSVSEVLPVYADAGERLGQYRQADRIAPVYTLCLYTGEKSWDGPRSLKDMVDFGGAGFDRERRKWEGWFADYPMRLICANEPVDGSGFRTALGIVFALLPLRKDKAGLRRLLEQDPAYQRMDEETATTVSLLMGVEVFVKQKEKYREGDGYNMCQAIREMMEDSRMEGEKAGWEKGEKAGWEKSEKTRREQMAEGIRIFIRSHRDEGATEETIADKLQTYYAMSEDCAQAALKDR